jgi:hypothetical protein
VGGHGQRSDLNAARISVEKSSGSSQLRGVRQISPANVVKPNAIAGGGKGSWFATGASGA